MDRRLFLFTGIAGLSDPAALLNTVSPAPVTRSGDPAFDAWSQDFLARAMAAGLPEALVRGELKDATPDPRVVAADHRQPEFTRPVGDYIRSAASASRIQGGLEHKTEVGPWLDLILTRFGVDPGVLIGIWGLESGYGLDEGDYDVVRSLATLAADGRRRAWAETELSDALRIVAGGRARRTQLTGSWAGAMGQTQLEPSEYLSRGVDVDGDGRVDIWNSPPDALGSSANILKQAGWRPGEDWAREARLPPGFDYALAEGPKQPPAWWAARGVQRADGQPWAAADQASPCQLLVPAGALGPAFLALPNHFVIRAYNNSISYALAVGLIADGVEGRPPLAAAWPVEAPMASDDRIGAQTALKALGYDPGPADGRIGAQTRAALRAWQGKSGLAADGHLTVDLSRRLQQEAAARPAP
ncbi:MAG TPA: lytic murein transglycosylase [Caulobacteraceae bacterium]